MGDDNNTLWIARDEDGYLYLYNDKPSLDEDPPKTFFTKPTDGGWWMRLDKELYPEVTFENSPQRLIPENSKTN